MTAVPTTLYSCDDHLEMWASDYPHPDSTFPHSRAAVAEAFAGLEADFVERVTATNCARLYRFTAPHTGDGTPG